MAAAAAAWLARIQTAGAAAVQAVRWLASLCYLVTTPLRYPLYHALRLVFRLLAFLLSPVGFACGAAARAGGWVVGLAVRLKYLYIYLASAALIGLVAGLALYGTSNFIFVLLGVDSSSSSSSSEKERRRRQRQRYLDGDEDDGMIDDQGIELELWSGGDGSSTMISSSSGPGLRRSGKKPEQEDRRELLLENQWKLSSRASEKPRRRRRGLLAQTIHEESSESDSL